MLYYDKNEYYSSAMDILASYIRGKINIYEANIIVRII